MPLTKLFRTDASDKTDEPAASLPRPLPLLASQLNLPFCRCFFRLFDFGEFWSFCCEEFSIVIRTLSNGWRCWYSLECKVNRVDVWNTREDFGFDQSMSKVCPKTEFKRWAFAFGFVRGLEGPSAPRRKLWLLRSLSFFFVLPHTCLKSRCSSYREQWSLFSPILVSRSTSEAAWIVDSAKRGTVCSREFD